MTTQAPRVGGRVCPIDCGATVRPGHIMCAHHWRTVPAATRSTVWRTWGRFNETGTDTDWAAYALAREDALTSARVAAAR